MPYLSPIECGKCHRSFEGEEKCDYLNKGEVTGGGICTPVDKGEVAGGGICAPAGLLASYREGGIEGWTKERDKSK